MQWLFQHLLNQISQSGESDVNQMKDNAAIQWCRELCGAVELAGILGFVILSLQRLSSPQGPRHSKQLSMYSILHIRGWVLPSCEGVGRPWYCPRLVLLPS